MGDFVSLKYDFSFKNLFLNETVRRCFISDALRIPLSEIRSVRLANPFLWKRFMQQKQGILEAIKEVRLMGMSKTLKMLHDAHMKERRDQNARDDYVWNEGRLEGEDRFGQLVLKLTADNRLAEIQQVAADKAYRDKLYQEYKL